MASIAPVDFLSGLGGLENLPNPFRDQQQVQRAQTQQLLNQSLVDQRNATITAQQDKARREAEFKSGVQNAVRTGDWATVFAAFPDQAENLKKTHDALDEPTRKATERDLFAVRSYIDRGNIDGAKKTLQGRIDAGRAAGEDTSDDQEMLDDLASGDPGRVKSAADMALFAILPADKRDQIFKPNASKFSQLGSGGIFNQETGDVVREPYIAPELRSVGPGETIVEISPGGGGGGPLTGAAIETAALQAIPGLTVTSRARTPEHNREVGGVPNSLHLSDQARDFVPPQGMSFAQAAAMLRARIPGARVINEGDHIHVQAPSRGGGGARVVASGGPKEREAPSGYRWKADGTLEAIAGGPGDAKYGKDNRKAETDLRKEFNNLPEVKNFKTIHGAFQTIRGLSRAPSAQNDIALIFSYMKMLDPTSVVREGEFATAQNATGVPDRIKNSWNKALSGERLNPDQREEMLASALNVYRSNSDIYNAKAGEYQGYASAYGIDPKRVARRYVSDRAQPASTTPAQPRVGEVRKGYRFKGGNPADRNSWVKANG